MKETAHLIQLSPSELEFIWRGASAAAHGKGWFTFLGNSLTKGEEYEPGYFRVTLTPDPEELTNFVDAASRMIGYSVVRFIMLAGYDAGSIMQAATERLLAVIPRKRAGSP